MTVDEFPDAPEIVDIALRDALCHAEHPRVRELVREALQHRFGVLQAEADGIETLRTDEPPRLEAWFNDVGLRYEERERHGAWIEADADTIEEAQP